MTKKKPTTKPRSPNAGRHKRPASAVHRAGTVAEHTPEGAAGRASQLLRASRLLVDTIGALNQIDEGKLADMGLSDTALDVRDATDETFEGYVDNAEGEDTPLKPAWRALAKAYMALCIAESYLQQLEAVAPGDDALKFD